MKKVAVALAVLAPCLLFSATADASPVRKAHARPHRQTHRVATTTQAFARIASRDPERRVYRHPPSWLKKTLGSPQSDDHDAAIQSASPASADAPHDAPALRPLELLVSSHAQIQSHNGFASSSPRAPPACS
ncbi:MAG TPA: hypothetical protein VLV86_10330 [Vicinamibacterales bacterium]|nr:hypothetical protein [Vicinamibacterales bacterium]